MTNLSFIIPAYNEEQFISDTVSSIHDNVPERYTYEIIVIDHGSTDRTAELAKNEGADVLTAPNADTISELRNLGVSNSSGQYLIFVDADTSLSSQWKENISLVLDMIDENPSILTGSKRVIPEDSDWLNKSWNYSPASNVSPSHLGGGHLIMTRHFFNEIGGFSTEYETGEDFEICVRAKEHGAKIISHPELKAIHRGLPKSLKHFLAREIWHGRGDSKNITSILGSKVSMVSIFFVLAHFGLIVNVVLPHKTTHISAALMLLIFFICLGSSVVKTKSFLPKYIFGNTILFYLYYWGRAFSMISILLRPNTRKRARNS